MKKLIIINGKAESGKDSFVTAFTEAYSGGYGDVANISTITKVKEFAELFGWKGEKHDKARKFLSDIKDAWTAFNDGPFWYVMNFVNERKWDFDYIFVHVREPYEIEKLVNHFRNDCVSLLIKRKGLPTPDNHADSNTDKYNYDYTIFNDGSLNDMIKHVNCFIDYLNNLRQEE